MQTSKQLTHKEIRALTAAKYDVPKGEEHFYHCRIEQIERDTKTGDYKSVPRIQKFGIKYFTTQGLSNLKKQDYQVDILHDGKKWVEENQQLIKNKELERKEQLRLQAEQKAQAEREKLKAELREELKAEMNNKG